MSCTAVVTHELKVPESVIRKLFYHWPDRKRSPILCQAAEPPCDNPTAYDCSVCEGRLGFVSFGYNNSLKELWHILRESVSLNSRHDFFVSFDIMERADRHIFLVNTNGENPCMQSEKQIVCTRFQQDCDICC